MYVKKELKVMGGGAPNLTIIADVDMQWSPKPDSTSIRSMCVSAVKNPHRMAQL